MQLMLLIATTFIVGTLIGTVGVGGILLIPALGAFAGLSTHLSMGTALFSFIFTGVLGTLLYQRRGSIDWEITIPLCAGALLFGYLGALANAGAPAKTLNVILSLIIIFAGVYALKRHAPAAASAPPSKTARRARLLAIGAAVGFGSGLTGVGGPVLSVPIMVACGFPPLSSIAAGQVVQIAAALSGSIGNLRNSLIDFSIVWWLTPVELAGVAAGVYLAHSASNMVLKKVVSAVCIGLGGYLLLRSLQG